MILCETKLSCIYQLPVNSFTRFLQLLVAVLLFTSHYTIFRHVGTEPKCSAVESVISTMGTGEYKSHAQGHNTRGMFESISSKSHTFYIQYKLGLE